MVIVRIRDNNELPYQKRIMKLLINVSTLSGTGVIQVAVSFIEECKKFCENDYSVLISKGIASQIDKKSFPSNFKFYEIEGRPRLLFKGYSTRQKLRKLEMETNPDFVFSVFGPSYWTPKSPHLMGYAYAHYVYSESPLFKIMPWHYLLKTKIHKFFHNFFLKRNGAYFVCETNDVAIRLVKFLNISQNNVYTVSNTFNHFFNDFSPSSKNLLPIREKDEYRLLSLCSFEPHKNLEILNKVIPILNSRFKNRRVKFVLTVDDKLLQSKMSDEARGSIINIGRVDVSLCPQLYYECDALFLPTLLECFSANYPESMKMKRPILTSNLSFATMVCQKAALYFDPLDPDDIVEKVIRIIEDKDLNRELVENGLHQLQSFKSSEDRTKAYLEIFEKILKNAKNPY